MKKMFIAAVLIVSGLLSACNQLTPIFRERAGN
ncbi:lipoprotein yceB [Klebsiella grimontii]|uniref:Lipoprotein yceB n=1 Tax=Klebsiella grimontii TaxID=2058152 RepID=A0A7H4P677_9ENTR|nr:lipoprotein yceB [Klebsiella grimontii]